MIFWVQKPATVEWLNHLRRIQKFNVLDSKFSNESESFVLFPAMPQIRNCNYYDDLMNFTGFSDIFL